jgi:protein-L-isoaspartate(D-aspartate) O-methyltransferase
VTFRTRADRMLDMLRDAGVTDARVLEAMVEIPREAFVPPLFRDRAYEDTALPIGHGQTISRPVVVGLMTQALDVGRRRRVLEVGTGSGYQTAVLARLSGAVYTIEIQKGLAEDAKIRLKQLGFDNVIAKQGDGTIGWRPFAPFDRILAAAVAADVPAALADQLAEDGVMVLPIGVRRTEQRMVKVTRRAGKFEIEEMGAAHFVPFVGEHPSGSPTLGGPALGGALRKTAS